MRRKYTFEKAFKAFQAILRKSPNNVASKAGIFEIANKFFEKNDQNLRGQRLDCKIDE